MSVQGYIIQKKQVGIFILFYISVQLIFPFTMEIKCLRVSDLRISNQGRSDNPKQTDIFFCLTCICGKINLFVCFYDVYDSFPLTIDLYNYCFGRTTLLMLKLEKKKQGHNASTSKNHTLTNMFDHSLLQSISFLRKICLNKVRILLILLHSHTIISVLPFEFSPFFFFNSYENKLVEG